MPILTLGSLDQDPQKEECQEGYPVLLNGLWCFGHRYVGQQSTQPDVAIDPYLGRTTFVNTLCGKKVLAGKDADDATNAHLEEGVRIKPITVGMIYNNVTQWNRGLTNRRIGIG